MKVGFDEQLRCRKVVLGKISQEQPIRWKDIIRGTIEETGYSMKSQTALDGLLRGGYIRRVSRGVYETTAKGTKFLAGLNDPCSPELTGHESSERSRKQEEEK